MLLILYFPFIFATNITWQQYEYSHAQYVPLILDTTTFTRNLNEFGIILNSSIDSLQVGGEQMCTVQNKYVVMQQIHSSFVTLISSMQETNIDDLTTSEIEIGQSQEIVSYSKSKNTILLLQNNGKLHSISFVNGYQYEKYQSYQLILVSNTNISQQLLQDDGVFYYVEGGEFIKIVIQNNQLYQFNFENWRQLNETFKAVIRNDYVYIINGNHNFNIYMISKHLLLTVNSFGSLDFYQNSTIQMNLLDLAISNKYLYILDQEQGIHRLNLQTNEIDESFFISITNGQSLAINESSLLVVHYNQQRSIITEFIIDDIEYIQIRKQTYNKKLFRKISIFEDSAILIGNTANYIYQTKLLQNASDFLMHQETSFYSLSILGVEQLNEHYYLSIQKDGIQEIYKHVQQSELICQGFNEGLFKIIINLNSTDCPQKNESNSFTYCQSKLEYEFDVHSTLMTQMQEEIYIYLCGFAGCIAIALISSLFFMYRKYILKKQKIDELNKKKRTQNKLNI